MEYHRKIIAIENLIVEAKYDAALQGYKEIITTFPFVFLRDIKVAAQLSAFTREEESTAELLTIGSTKGWKKRDIRKNKLLKPYISDLSRNTYTSPDPEALLFIDSLLRKDQKMALKALLKPTDKSKQKYYSQVFAPHSKIQISKLIEWLENNPWPGERTTGGGISTSTIVSHHNSIHKDFNQKDTLFALLDLDKQLETGYLSPFHYALMHEWRYVVSSETRDTYYGFIGKVKNEAQLASINEHRAKIGMRSIELRNQLLELEKSSDFNFYLEGAPWQKGKITIN